MPKHSDAEIKEATSRFEEWASTLTGKDFDDTGDLRAIAEASDGVRAGQARVRELVQLARSNGRSWGQIGIALGVSRQAARERFASGARR